MDSFHKQEQTSRTLEYAYDDFVLAGFAQRIGKTEESKALFNRAGNWRNVFDHESGFVRGKNADGSWFEPFDPHDPRAPFITEGTPFQYTWYVPHDAYGLQEAMGGKEAFVTKLDELFEGEEYWHGNEPGHQTAYMYAYGGTPWKSQKHIHSIIREEYGTGPGGLSGNEDAGQMSAWLVFSQMGFYPVCPGTPYYIIGTPSFDEVKIQLNSGETFAIVAENLSEVAPYIQSAILNGEEMDRAWLSHEEILKGGELRFVMGETPNVEWGASIESLPPNVMAE